LHAALKKPASAQTTSVSIVASPLAKVRASGDFAIHKNKNNFFPDCYSSPFLGMGRTEENRTII